MDIRRPDLGVVLANITPLKCANATSSLLAAFDHVGGLGVFLIQCYLYQGKATSYTTSVLGRHRLPLL